MTQNGGSTTFVVVVFDDDVLLLAFDFVPCVFFFTRFVLVVGVVEFVKYAAMALADDVSLASSLSLEVAVAFTVIMVFRSLRTSNANANAGNCFGDGTPFRVLVDTEI